MHETLRGAWMVLALVLALAKLRHSRAWAGQQHHHHGIPHCGQVNCPAIFRYLLLLGKYASRLGTWRQA